jgi:hypothetical protein
VTKRCTKCGEEKAVSEFHRERCRADGLRPQCRACTNSKNAARAAVNRDRKRAYDRERRTRLGEQLLERKRASNRKYRERRCAEERLRRLRCPERTIWNSMKARCGNPRNAAFSRYGGRGISVCARWRDSFECFLADMGARPSPQHSLDRIDVDGNYEPGNVRWATCVEQARNKRSSRLVSIDGVTRTVAEWAELNGVDPHPIYHRLDRGMDPRVALGLATQGAT